jgi:hypothetical protein
VENYENTNWWKYLDENMRDLVRQSFDLSKVNNSIYKDYAFVVFPAAKAYEGFLKKVFLEMRMITSQQYYSDHFRVGRALSPTLPKRYRVGWVYGKLVSFFQSETLPMEMWEVWKSGRNRLFHYFPQHQAITSLEIAVGLVNQITNMMGKVVSGCGLIH